MNDIRRKALARRVALGFPQEEPTPAETILAACAAATGLICAFSPDTSRPLPEIHFDAAHAFAHFWLHGAAHVCVPDKLASLQGGESGALGKVADFSPMQRREAEANLFAAELLLPGPLARRLFLSEGLSANAIGECVGLPLPVVRQQLSDAVLLPPPLSEAAPNAGPAAEAVTLDASQREAAEIAHGPLLLGAGPGTGKTKTLIGRCQFLTQTLGVPAEKILALTFSRQAAGEMRERLASAGVGTRGAEPWVGTFHRFGLDILRRFGDRLGLPPEVKLLDSLDAVTLLENHLPELQLDALDNLYNPAVHLGGIVKQISRAKDELCGPRTLRRIVRRNAGGGGAGRGGTHGQTRQDTEKRHGAGRAGARTGGESPRSRTLLCGLSGAACRGRLPRFCRSHLAHGRSAGNPSGHPVDFAGPVSACAG